MTGSGGDEADGRLPPHGRVLAGVDRPEPQAAASDAGDGSSSTEGAQPQADKQDVLFVHGPTQSGEGYDVVRHRQDRLEIGELRELRHGKPIVGEVVRLTPRKEQERMFDVEVLLEGADTQRSKQEGPAKVATAAYRENWNVIFGSTATPDEGGGDLLN